MYPSSKQITIYARLGTCQSVWMTVWYAYQTEKRNKHIKENCSPSWLYLQDYTGMHGQQNIKIVTTIHKKNLSEDGAISAETSRRKGDNTYILLLMYILLVYYRHNL